MGVFTLVDEVIAVVDALMRISLELKMNSEVPPTSFSTMR